MNEKRAEFSAVVIRFLLKILFAFVGLILRGLRFTVAAIKVIG